LGTVLVDKVGNSQVLRSVSVVGKVLAADLLDLDKLRNQFLLTAGSIGALLVKTYVLGPYASCKPVMLTPEAIADFF